MFAFLRQNGDFFVRKKSDKLTIKLYLLVFIQQNKIYNKFSNILPNNQKPENHSEIKNLTKTTLKKTMIFGIEKNLSDL